MFDRWSYFGDKRRRLMEQSWAGVFRNHLLVELPVDDLCRHLDERMGRPSKDLHVVIGVLLLQQLHDLSDAETVEALAFNMAWHYALDVRSEADSYFCEKTLRNYRRLFIEQGLDELLFRCLTDRMVQGFSVDTSHQRMDSTALRSAMRALTRLGIVVESISKFARELERYHPGLHEQISKEEIRRYVDREGNGAFANTAPSVSKRRLGEAGQDLLALVLQFRDTAAAKLSSFAILERVLRDQFEIVDDECGDRDAKRAAIRDPKDVPCDTVGNPADPDASYNAHKGQGYMAQIVETYCEDDSNEVRTRRRRCSTTRGTGPAITRSSICGPSPASSRRTSMPATTASMRPEDRRGLSPEPACWSHCRRKFFELADIAASRGRGKNAPPISPLALEAVKRIDVLFDIERGINGKAAEQRRAVRQELSAPVLADLKGWMQAERRKLSRHSPVAKAMDYMLRRWDLFARFLDDGRICLTNNAAERALRGIALGRKSWLFCGSDRGGVRAAAMYTLIGTAKLNNVDPQAWLADVLDKIAGTPQSQLDELLPWNWQDDRRHDQAA